MKLVLLSVLFSFGLLFISCRQEIVRLDQYGQIILDNSVFSDIPQLQSNSEIENIKTNKIRAMDYIKEYVDSSKVDSLTYLEFSIDGRLIQRTTSDITTVGCLHKIIKQVFNYDGDRIKRVDNYVFKYVTNSVLEKWMERDTSNLKRFDWEDYSYNGDTITVESGFAICKFIKNKDGKLIKTYLKLKTNNQISDVDYNYTPYGLLLKIKANNVKGQIEYDVKINTVETLNSEANSKTEDIYNDKGLLIAKKYFKNGKLVSKTKVDYFYYLNSN